MFGDQPGNKEEETAPQQSLRLPGYSEQEQLSFSSDETMAASDETVVSMGPLGSRAAGANQPYGAGAFAAGQPFGGEPSGRLVGQADLIRRSPSNMPTNPLGKLAYLWKSDPAYKVLIIAVAVVLISSVVLAAGLGVMMSKAASPSSQGRPTANTGGAEATMGATPQPTQAMAAPTATMAPTATPVPTTAPTATPVPTTAPTATPTATVTATTTNQGLTAEITSIPDTAQNNTTVQVVVQTNEAGAVATLTVAYENATPFTYTSQPQTTGNDGAAMLSWVIAVTPLLSNRNVLARVAAVVVDGKGQQRTTQTVTVQIRTK